MTQKKTSTKTANKASAKKTVKKTVAAKKPGLKQASVARSSGTSADGDKKATPIVFSLDDVEALVASKKQQSATEEATKQTAAPVSKPRVVEVTEDAPVEKRVLGAASLADILGFNPGEKKQDATLEADSIPPKWKKYYELLLELRNHVRDELDLHTADTLKHSNSEDAGDLAHYGNHQADAGTDTFDRDFALSLVSSEQDALNEIEEAILRIKDGSYGVCEVTGEAINKERLLAVPFARFSLKASRNTRKMRAARPAPSPQACLVTIPMPLKSPPTTTRNRLPGIPQTAYQETGSPVQLSPRCCLLSSVQ